MAIDNDFTSAGYNSYFSDVDAITDQVRMLNGSINISKWENLNSDIEKENVAARATKDINSFVFIGALNGSIISPFNMTWPRSGALYQNGVEIGDSETPQFVLEYIAWHSVELLDYNADQIKFLTRNKDVKSQKIGSLRKEFFQPDGINYNKIDLKDMPSYECIQPYIEIGSSDNLRYLIRA